jgi:hypothetical protein
MITQIMLAVGDHVGYPSNGYGTEVVYWTVKELDVPNNACILERDVETGKRDALGLTTCCLDQRWVELDDGDLTAVPERKLWLVRLLT